MINFLKKARLLALLAFLVLPAAKAVAENVNDWDDLDLAITSEETDISFTTPTINFTGNLLQISTNVSFSSSVTLNGGGLYRFFNFSASSSSFNDSINFVDGYAAYGGAIFLTSATSISNIYFMGSSSTFTGNIASSSGGAIYAEKNSNMIFTGEALFENNYGAAAGGAIFATGGSNLTFYDNVSFISNHSTGTNNASGGAAYLGAGTIIINGSAKFIGNEAAANGGALYLSGDYPNPPSLVELHGYAEFVGNTAINGGAIYFNSINSRVNFYSGSQTLFYGNDAQYGGAIFGLKNAGSGADIKAGATVIFASNTAVFNGGAIQASPFNSTNADVSFLGNKATNGGAISLLSGLSNSFIAGPGQGRTYFYANEATESGGAVYVAYADRSVFTLRGLIIFESNVAASSGGAIYNGAWSYYGGTGMHFGENSTASFIDNSAKVGGAIYNVRDIIFTRFKTLLFTENSADNGGAIYNMGYLNLHNSNLYGIFVSSFTNNTANNHGGAIYNAGSIIFNPDAGISIVFKDNNALLGKDIYGTASSTLSITGAGDVIFYGGIEGAGAIYKTGTGNANFAAGSKTNFGGTLNIDSGNVNFSTSAYFGRLNITTGTLGIDTDFSAALGTNTSFIYTTTTTIYTNGKLHISETGTSPSVIGSSTAIMFAGYNDGTVFSTSNISSAGGYGYKFVWENDNLSPGYDFTGWLIYGAFPWNNYVTEYLTGGTNGNVFLATDITASDGSDDPFGDTSYDDLIIGGYDGIMRIIDSDKRNNKGFTLDTKTMTFQDLEFKNFVSTSSGSVINAVNSNIKFEGDAVKFTDNRASNGGAIYLDGNSTIDFGNSDITATGNVAVSSGGFLFSDGGKNIEIDLDKIHLESNTARTGGTFYGQNGTTFTFTAANSNISNSTASYAGGFIALGAGGTADFSNTILNASTNTAVQRGGFMYLANGAKALFGSANFTNNKANNFGGAIYNAAGGIFTLTGSTLFNGNISLSSGGAIYNEGTLNFTTTAGSTITFTNNSAAFGRDILGINNSILNINGVGNVVFGGGIEGAGTINKTNTGNVYFMAGSKTDFKGTFNITGGSVYFSTSASIKELNIGAGTIGIDTDFSSAFGTGTSFIYTTTMTITDNSKLHVTETGTPSVIGSSTAIMFTHYSDKAFLRSNISSDGGYGYRFVWANDNLSTGYGFTGWLVYGAFPWNDFVKEFQKTGTTGGIYLAINITAEDEDENPFNETLSNNFIIGGHNGNMQTIDSSSKEGKGFILTGKTVTFKDLTFQNFVRTGDGGVISASHSEITFSGNAVNFISNTAGDTSGAIFAQAGSNINFTSSTINFTSNTATSGGGTIYAGASSNINFTGSTVNFTSNTTNGSGGAIVAEYSSNINFTSSTASFTRNTANNSGGAVFVNDSGINFTSSTVNFTNNTANRGGAIYINGNNSTIDFGNSQITATGNVAASSGGFIYSQGNNNININLDNVYLESNTAAVGGTFYGQSGTTFTFTAANSNISNSTASYAGGFIALGTGGTADFSNTILNASSNTAVQRGGFMYLADGAKALFGSANFTNNSANYGGAIYNEGILNLTAISASTITFANNSATAGRDIYGTAGSELNINGLGDIVFGGGIEGAGTINKINTGNVYFAAGSKTDFAGTFNINGGSVYFSTSAKITELNVTTAAIGIDINFQSANSYIYTTTTTLTNDSKLYVTETGTLPSVIGSSTAIMFANYNNDIAFSTTNITGSATTYGYKFVWKNDRLNPAYGLTGWLVYGSSPWNNYVNEYKTVVSGGNVFLATDIIAADGDENPFNTTNSDNLTIAGHDGNMYAIDADGKNNKGFYLSGKTLTFKDLTFQNFISTGNGGVIQAINNSTITFNGNAVNFTSNTANLDGGAIYAGYGSNINFTSSTVNFTSNTAENWSGGAIYLQSNSDINFTSSTVNFTGNTSGQHGGAIYASEANVNFTGSTIKFTSNTALEAGAVFAYVSNINFTDSIVNFTNNTSEHGSAISARDSDINFTSSKVNFTSNTASWEGGGAIYASGNSNNSNINFTSSTINFTNNTANTSGGAIYLRDNSTAFTLTGSALFDGNIAVSSGGAIYNAGLLNLGAAAGSTITFINNSAAAGRDIYGINNSVVNINGLGDIVFGGGIEGAGTINKTNTGNVYFAAGSKTDFGGTFNINGGRVYFSTSAKIKELNIGAATLGIDADFSAALGAATSFIYADTITFGADSKLYVNRTDSGVIGSSTAVMFANNNNGVEFSTSNIVDNTGKYGYKFVWENESLSLGYGLTGWLVYGGNFPWNNFVAEYQKSGTDNNILYLAANIKAGDDGEDPFGTTLSNNFTIAGDSGNMYVIDADGKDDKGFYLDGQTLTFKDLAFENFVSAGNGGVIQAINNSTITFSGNAINFTSNTAREGGAIFAGYDSNINFTSSTVDFTSNTASDGGAISTHGTSNINFTNSTVNFTSNTARSEAGGAIFARYGSNINFTSSTVNFTNNMTNFIGGAIYIGSSNINFTSSTINFTSNTTNAHGGAILAESNSNINFTSSTVNFTNNTINYYSGGAIHLESNSNINFTSSTVNFTSNTANGYGGAICNDNGVFTINGGSALFYGNIAVSSGGAIYNAGTVSLGAISASTITFANNSAAVGRDIYGVNNSVLNINGLGDIVFGGGIEGAGTINKTNTGNVYFAAGSKTYFDGTFNINEGAVHFSTSVYVKELNITTGTIGIDADFSSALGNNTSFIYTTTTTLTSDSKLYVNNLSTGIAVSSTAVMFAQYRDGKFEAFNVSAGYRFAWAADNLLSSYTYTGWLSFAPWNYFAEEYQKGKASVIYLTDNIKAENDDENPFSSTLSDNFTIAGHDGNMYVIDADGKNNKGFYLSEKTLTFKDLTFQNFVSTTNGSVIQATNSDITFGGNAVNFTSNTANYGGAIALSDGGSIEFTGDEAIFRNNSATGEGGAIYAEGKAGNTDKTILSVLNGNLIFEGNNANGTANDIYLGENINFELRTGSNSVVSMDGGIKGLENSMFTKTGSGKMELLNGSINKYYGEFKIEQGIVEVNETAEATFGKLNIEANGIYSLVNGNAQQVTTAGEAKINGTLEIDVDFDNNIADILKAKTDTMQGASGKIIIGNTGKLGVNIIGTDEETMRITIIEGNIGSNRFTNDNPFIVSGYTKTPGGYNYTLDYFTDHIDVVKSKGTTLRTIAGLTHNQAEVAKIADKISDSSHRRGEFVEIINRIEAMTDNNAKKKALNEMSGSVIANILSAGVYDNEELFSRIQPQTKETSKKVWGQVYTYGRTNNADENSTEDFSISGYGIEAGADLISAESIVAGVYGLYENSSGEQGESKGDIGALGIGVYGGWFGENLDIKARIYGGKLQYKIDRALETLGEKAESETDGYNLKWDILGQYNIWYKEGLSIAPYGQIKSGYAMNSGTKEKGRDGENIEIYDETYLRVEGRIGVGINYAINRLNLYGKISAGFIAAGDKAQYKGEFLDSAEEMEIWGADAGKINGGLGLGASYEITNSWNAYANINGNYSENSKEYFANIGVNYAF